MLLCGELQPDDTDEQQPHENEPRGGDGLLKSQNAHDDGAQGADARPDTVGGAHGQRLRGL